MQVTYTGPFESVVIAATDQVAERGTPVDVDASVAAELCRQDTWAPIGQPARTATKAVWIDYGASLGHDPDQLAALTKAELVDTLTNQADQAQPQED